MKIIFEFIYNFLRQFYVISLCFVLSVFFQACFANMPETRPFIIVQDKPLEKKLVKKIVNLYPKSFSTIHRYIIDIKNKQYVFLGYIVIERQKKFRMIAKGDMGGTVFELFKNISQKTVIKKNYARIHDKFLTKGFSQYIDELYMNFPSRFSKVTLIKHEPKTICIRQLCGNRYKDYIFYQDTMILKKMIISQNDRIYFDVNFLYKNEQDYDILYFDSIETMVINDYHLKFKLIINVIEMSMLIKS